MFGKFIVDYFAYKRKIVVQKQFDDVYSIRESELQKKIDHALQVGLDNQLELARQNGILNALLGVNPQPRNPGASVEEAQRYANALHNSIGGVLEGLPEPPAALTGRKRGAS